MGRLRTGRFSLVVSVLLAMGTTTAASQSVDGPPATSAVLERLYGTYHYAGDPAAADAEPSCGLQLTSSLPAGCPGR